MDRRSKIDWMGLNDPEKRKVAFKQLVGRFSTAMAGNFGKKLIQKTLPPAGMYIIDQGRCKVVQYNKDGSFKKVICVIARNDTFGGSQQLKIPVSDFDMFLTSCIRRWNTSAI